MKSVPQLIAVRCSMREQQTTTQLSLIVLRRVDCRWPFNAKTKQQQLHHECRSAHRKLFGVRSKGKTNNSRLTVSRRIECGSASERSRTATEQTPNKPVNPSGGWTVFVSSMSGAAAGLPWTLALHRRRTTIHSDHHACRVIRYRHDACRRSSMKKTPVARKLPPRTG